MARDFDGIDDVITVADSASISVFSGNFTIGFWFWLDSYDGSFSTIIAKGPADGSYDFGLLIQNESQIYIPVGNVTAGAGAVTTSGFTLNAWHYLLVTRASGITVNVYLNDMATAHVSLSGGTGDDTDGSMFIGLRKYVGNGNTNGRVANVIIYNRALTEAERITCKSGANVPASGLMMYLPLTGTESPELDISGNGNDGVVTGTTPVAGPPDVEEPSVEASGGGPMRSIGAIHPIYPILNP